MKELLLNKGFKLNTYPEGKYYEWETTDKNIISNVQKDDYIGEEKLILQCKEDFTNCILCIDCNIWDLE